MAWVALTQILWLGGGLWLASDLYEWARWAQESGAPDVGVAHPGYFATPTGGSAAGLSVAWVVCGAAIVALAAFFEPRPPRT